MSEMLDRVIYAMDRYSLEEMVDDTFSILEDCEKVVRSGLTSADEPYDIVDQMNARAVIEALRTPIEMMLAAGYGACPFDPGPSSEESDMRSVWQAMLEEALR